MIIYKATNKLNGKIYIGQTVMNLQKRIGCHFCTRNGVFSHALRKYGLQSFDFSVIDSADNQESLKEKEIYWIKFYNCKVPNGYNITDGGNGGMLGYKASDETRRKQSLALKGRIRSPEAVLKSSQSLMGHPVSIETRKKISEATRKRPPISEETRKRLSESRKGKKRTEDFKKKMSEIRKGIKASPETKRKLSEIHKSLWKKDDYRNKQINTRTGKKLSKEHKQKISESNKGRAMSVTTKEKISIKNKYNWAERKNHEISGKECQYALFR